MIPFDDAHRAVHYPKDRRFRIWIRPSIVILLIVLALVPFVLAWVQHAFFGLPYIAPSPASLIGAPSGPHGFPVWIRWSHFFNLFFLVYADPQRPFDSDGPPAAISNDHCTPGTEWIRFTPLTVPKDRLWTAKDDARYISPAGRDCRISSHGRGRALVAFHQRLWIRAHWCCFRHAGCLPAEQWQRLVPTSSCRFRRGLEHVRPLRKFPLAARTEWVLRLQRAAATRLFRHDLRYGPALHPHRHGHVSRAGQSLSRHTPDSSGDDRQRAPSTF